MLGRPLRICYIHHLCFAALERPASLRIVCSASRRPLVVLYACYFTTTTAFRVFSNYEALFTGFRRSRHLDYLPTYLPPAPPWSDSLPTYLQTPNTSSQRGRATYLPDTWVPGPRCYLPTCLLQFVHTHFISTIVRLSTSLCNRQKRAPRHGGSAASSAALAPPSLGTAVQSRGRHAMRRPAADQWTW